MPALKNTKHERFAQELAKGKSQSEAYAAAGYAPSEPNASRLTRNDKVQARVAELQERSAERAVVTTESLIEEAADIQTKALAAGQFGPAISALTAKAKLAGKWIERSEQGKPGDFSRMSDAELRDFIAREAGALGAGDAGVAAPRGQAGVRGKPSELH